MKQLLSLLFLIPFLVSCQNQNSTKEEITDSTQTNSTIKEEIKETDFDIFFEKYRSDSIFQINRTKFPLKTSNLELEEITTTFTQKRDWKFNNFEDNRKTEYDQYEYVKEIGNANLVLYEMRGIDNGILVIYKFTFTNQEWILEEIEDASN
jgi:hypothetical protein